MTEPQPFRDSQPYLPHLPCADINVLATQMESMMEWRKETARKLDELVADGSRVRLLEHQMLSLNQTLERLTEVVERLEQRLIMLEKHDPANERLQKWADKGIWAGLGVLAVYVLKKVGML